MPSSKEAVILVVVSLIAIALIFSSSSSRFAQAVPVFGPAGEKKCTKDFSTFLPTRSCCWIDTDTEAYKKFCEVCTYQPDGTYGDCKTTEGPVAFAPTPPTTNPPSAKQPPPPPPPSNALPPSSSPSPSQQQTTKTCPDGSTPDANGKCPTTTTTNQQVAPPSKHHHKASS